MSYTGINPETEIRILRLRSSANSKAKSASHLDEAEPLYGELFVVRREDKPEYDALSYTWGKSSITKLMFIKFSAAEDAPYAPVPILEPLHDALKHLRKEDVDILIWTDKLCINQADNVEKGIQVQKMTDVYASASRTKVWLGPASSSTDSVFSRLTTIGAECLRNGAFDLAITMHRHSAQLSNESYTAEQEFQARIRHLLYHDFAHEQESYQLLYDVKELLSRRYWTRVWILQEIVVSNKVDVHCGTVSMDVKTMHAAVLYLNYMRPRLHDHWRQKLNAALEIEYASWDKEKDPEPDYDPGMKKSFDDVGEVSLPDYANMVFGMRQAYQNPNLRVGAAQSLIQLLSQIRAGRESEDEKDRIYALLGMASDATQLDIPVRYGEEYTCEQLYRDTARAIIEGGDIDLLSFVQTTRNQAQNSLPSWVPDWREEVNEPLGMFPWHTPYNAAGMLAPATPNTTSGNGKSNPQHLQLSGYKIDRIQSLEDQCNGGKWLGTGNRSAARKYLSDIQKLCQESDRMGQKIYKNDYYRTLAMIAVPIAALIGQGFYRLASAKEEEFGWLAVVKDSGDAANAQLTDEEKACLQPYYVGMARQVARRPFLTTRGHVGLAPGQAQEGDVIVIFRGAKLPYTLRPLPNGSYSLVGETYVHGLMSGEVIELGFELEEFSLE